VRGHLVIGAALRYGIPRRDELERGYELFLLTWFYYLALLPLGAFFTCAARSGGNLYAELLTTCLSVFTTRLYDCPRTTGVFTFWYNSIFDMRWLKL